LDCRSWGRTKGWSHRRPPLAAKARMPNLRCEMRLITYKIGTSGQTLVLNERVLYRFKKFAQTGWWQREAGGQLFSKFDGNQVSVAEATGPRKTDRRGRTWYEPDKAAEQREIDERFPLGLHFIGDWHTHPEDIPNPSQLDLRSISEGFRRSKHGLNAFVIIIVRRFSFPNGLHVSLHDGSSCYVLSQPLPTVERSLPQI